MHHRKPGVKMRFWRIYLIVNLVGADIFPIDLPFEQTALFIKGGGNVVCWLLLLLTIAGLFIVLCIIVLGISYYDAIGIVHMI